MEFPPLELVCPSRAPEIDISNPYPPVHVRRLFLLTPSVCPLKLLPAVECSYPKLFILQFASPFLSPLEPLRCHPSGPFFLAARPENETITSYLARLGGSDLWHRGTPLRGGRYQRPNARLLRLYRCRRRDIRPRSCKQTVYRFERLVAPTV